jgi:two-component system response regulator
MDVPQVLLVEDNEDDVLLARRALGRVAVPHRLRVVRDGEEARAVLLDEGVELPSVVLLDLNLPKLDGKTVLREIRGNPRTARVPVVVLTSSRLERDVIDAYSLGANSYYQKPVDLEEFLDGISLVLTYWFLLNVPVDLERMSARLPPTQLPRARFGCRTPQPHRVPRLPEILIVDSHADDRAQTEAILKELGCADSVASLGSFADSARFLRGLQGPPPYLVRGAPHLVFVDVDLAGGDGRDLLQALRYRCDHHVLVVVFTRSSDLAAIRECYRLKVNSVVAKPTNHEDYVRTVRIICHYWIRLNERPPPADLVHPSVPRPG